MLHVVPVPSVVQGVSQLAPEIRLPSHLSASDNTWPSLIDGLQKRPPTVHQGYVFGGLPPAVAMHAVDAGTDRQYLLHARSDGVSAGIVVTDLEGNTYNVWGEPTDDANTGTQPNWAYLQSPERAPDALRFLTVQDYTIVTNRTRPVLKDPTVFAPVAGRYRALIWIRRGDYKAVYSLHFNSSAIGGEQTVRVKTWDGQTLLPGELTDPYTPAIGSIRAQDIAQSLKSQLDALAALNTGWNLVADVTGTNDSYVVMVSVDPTDAFTLFRVEAAGRDAIGVFDAVDTPDDLPDVAQTGIVVKVRGALTENADDYYLSFEESPEATGGISNGTWVECTEPSGSDFSAHVVNGINPSTAPHALTRRTDLVGNVYFTFEELDWEDRAVGDDASNPFPPWVSTATEARAVLDVALFRGRLAIVSKDRCSLSGAGSLFSFFRTSIKEVLADDPLETTSGDTSVVDLYAAVPFNRQLVLFSRAQQFVVEGEPNLTPTTATSGGVLANPATPTCPPAAQRRSLVFGAQNGSYSQVYEMAPVDAASVGFDSVDLSLHVPRYIPGTIERLAASATAGVLVALPADNGRYLYVYKTYVEGQSRVQSAWQRWDFGQPAGVRGCAFVGTTLYLDVARDEGVALETIDLSAGADVGAFLDRRVTLDPGDVTYDADRNVSTIVCPFRVNIEQHLGVVDSDGRWFRLVSDPYTVYSNAVDLAPTTSVEVYGDATAADECYIGFLFPWSATVDKPFVPTVTPEGRHKMRDGRHWVLWASAFFADSGPVDSTVSNPDVQETQTHTPDAGGAILVSGAWQGDYTARCMIAGESDKVSLTFSSLGPFPVNLRGITWEIDYTPVGRPTA